MRDRVGEDHTLVAICQNNLARIHRLRGDLERAEALNREALGRFRELLGEDHQFVARSLFELAWVLLENASQRDAVGIPDIGFPGYLAMNPVWDVRGLVTPAVAARPPTRGPQGCDESGGGDCRGFERTALGALQQTQAHPLGAGEENL